MTEKTKKETNRVKDLALRIARTTTIAILIYLVYLLIAPVLTTFSSAIPGLNEMIELLIAVNIVLLIFSDLIANTVFHCFLDVGRAVFTIAFIVSLLGNGVLNVSYQNYTLTINLMTICGIAALLGLLGLSKSVLQAINFMSERAESGLKP